MPFSVPICHLYILLGEMALHVFYLFSNWIFLLFSLRVLYIFEIRVSIIYIIDKCTLLVYTLSFYSLIGILKSIGF